MIRLIYQVMTFQFCQQNKWKEDLSYGELIHFRVRLLCHLLVILKVISANSVDPDQTAPLGAV